MSRPGDWHVLDLDRDPVPGDPFTMRSLARKLRETSEDARRAERDVRSLAGDGALLEWLGLAGEEFKGAIGEFPGQLAKVRDSYDRAADAVTSWAGELEGAQAQADRALEQGRQAREEIERARAVLSSAQWSADSASRSADRLQDPGAGAEPPDAEQVRQAVRNAQTAASRVASARGGVEAAERKLDLARRLALQAAEARDEAGDRAAREVRAAAEAGIEPTSFWDKVKSAAGKAWEILVIVAKVVVAVLGIVVLIIGGPLAWVVFAAALLVLADTVMKWVQGRASAMDLVWALVDCIPGTKGITTAAKLLKGAKSLASGAAKGTAALKGMADALRGITAGARVIVRSIGDIKVGVVTTLDGLMLPMVDASSVGRALSEAKDARRSSPGSGPVADAPAPAGPRSDVLPDIDGMVSRQAQARHVKDAPQYGGGGYFESTGDAQKVLDAAKSGTAEILGTTRTGHVLVRVSGVRAYNNNPQAGYLDQPTDTFMIKGSRKVSVVPVAPGRTA